MSAVDRSAVLDGLPIGPWERFTTHGAFARDPVREHRLRLDDCAMLGGLLCDLLGVNKWELFLRAITARPLCSERYVLTGRGKVDRLLSRVLNRAWLGDAGGALAVAAGHEWTGGYDDALELLGDVQAVVEPS